MKSAAIEMSFILVAIATISDVISSASSATEPSVYYIVEEEQPIGTMIGDLRKDATLTTILNERDLATATFHFLSPRPSTFQVDAHTGLVRTAERLDRELVCAGLVQCSLSAELAVQGSANFKVVIVKMVVAVLDLNDNAPSFPTPSVTLTVSEAATIGTALTLPSAYDPDTPQFGVKDYSLVTSSQQDGDAIFELQATRKSDGSTDVKLILIKALDHEIKTEHILKVMVTDGGNPALTGRLDVTIDVRDANDHAPVFDQPQYHASISEDAALYTDILRVHATDNDAASNGRIVYALSEQTTKAFGRTFAIDNTTGVIRNLQSLDAEMTSSYTLTVRAFDQGTEQRVTEVTVTVNIDDVNDNAPEVTVSALYASPDGDTVHVHENMTPGGFVAQVIVNDRDTSSDSFKINCTMTNPNFRFTRRSNNSNKYQLLTAVTFDREVNDEYDLQIVCQDRGNPPLSTTQHVSILILDDNDNSPAFDKQRYDTTIIERNYEHAFVIKVNATDPDLDANGDVTYWLSDHAAVYFSIDSKSGIIRAVTSLDRERTPRLTFEVFASDSSVTSRHTSSAEVEITVLDVNDEQPQFVQPNGYLFTVPENSKAGRIVGNVSATDGDSDVNAMITYSLALTGSAVGLFVINPTTGVISLSRSPDREVAARHQFTVLARDSGNPSLTGTTFVSVSVSDANDNAPIFRFPSGLNSSLVISNDLHPGYVIGRVNAYDVDEGENAKLSYAILSGNDRDYFSIDPQYGALITNIDLRHIVYTTVTLEIVAKDNGQPSLSTVGILVVTINGSLAVMATARAGGGERRGGLTMLLAGQNAMVMLVLITLTVLVACILITVVACLKCSDRRLKSARYNCHMETVRTLSSNISTPTCLRRDAVVIATVKDGHSEACDRLLMQEHRHPCSSSCHDDCLQVTDNNILRQKSTYYPQCDTSCCSSSEHEINYELLQHDQLRHHHHQQQQQEQQADDVISLRSADGSNTDSGRGGSELEGDTARHPLPPPAPSSAQPPASPSPTRERADPTAAGAGLCKLCDVTQPARSVPTLEHVTQYGEVKDGCTFQSSVCPCTYSPSISVHQMVANQILSARHVTSPPPVRSRVLIDPLRQMTSFSTYVPTNQQTTTTAGYVMHPITSPTIKRHQHCYNSNS